MIRTKEHQKCHDDLQLEQKEHGRTLHRLMQEETAHIILKQQIIIEAYRDAYLTD